MKKSAVIKEAKDNVRRYVDFYREFRKVARDDMDFINGDQWTSEDKQKRFYKSKEVINDSKITKRRTVEDYDKKRSSIKVKGNDNSKDKLTTEAFQGLIYDINNKSLGEAVKDHAMSDMLDCGMGFYRWTTEFDNDLSFDQSIKYKPIFDPFNVFLDILNNLEIDNSDTMWGGWIDYYTEEDFKEEWPKASVKGFPGLDDNTHNTTNGKIGVCWYYRIELVSDTLISIANPETGDVLNAHISDFNEKHRSIISYYETQGYTKEKDLFEWINETGRLLSDRDIQRRVVEWYLLTDDEVLDKGIIGGEFIPIIPMLGPRYIHGGNVYRDSLIRQTKAPTRLNNFVISNYVDAMAVDPIAPYVSDFRKIERHMGSWANANNDPRMVLPFDPVEISEGQWDITPPQRQPKGDVPAGWATLFQFTQEAKQRTSGLPDSALGMAGNEISMGAINARTDNGLANRSIFFKCRHFSDQLLGKQLEKAIPVYYDSARLVSLATIDGKSKVAKINEEEHKEGEGQYKGKFIDIKNAKITTYITVGASYNSLREETTDKLMSILPIAGDRYRDVIFPEFMKYIDVVDSEELYENCMKVAPQEIRDIEEEKTPQQLQAELAQAQQELEQLKQVNQEMEKVLVGEEQKVRSQESQTQMKLEADLLKAKINNEGSNQRERMSNLTDIKQAEIQAQSRKEIELIKQSMGDMSKKMDMLITAITAKSEN